MKTFQESFARAPWGRLALVSWGDPGGAPVLLVHGREDSAAAFIPLLELLPDGYHYVAVDLPGHGKSDPFPTGVMLMRGHFIAAVEAAIEHLGWKQFVYIAHSMGTELGLFYNVVHPGRVTRMVLLDPGPSMQRLFIQDPVEYFDTFYRNYYLNYTKYNVDERVYTKRRALDAVMRSRGLTEEQAELILSRNLTPVGEDQYKISWDRRLKFPAPHNYTPEYYLQLFSGVPPTLVIAAETVQKGYKDGKIHSDKLLQNLKGCVKDFFIETVVGGHDVHFTNADRVAGYIAEFLERDFGRTKSKL